MLVYLGLALGGAIGTIGRYALNGVISQRFGQTLPLGTMVISITGSLSHSPLKFVNQPIGAA